MELNDENFNIFSIIDIVKDHSSSILFLQSKGILRFGFQCQECLIDMSLIKDNSAIDRHCFRCKECRKKKSIRHGSFLSKSKLELRHFIMLIYFWSTKTHAGAMQTHLSLSNVSIVVWTKFIREVCSSKLMNLNPKIGGPGKIIQIDESVIYKAKYNLGHALFARKKWILGFYDVEHKVGFVRFLQDRSADTLNTLIMEHVEPGSEIHTDCWAGYNNIVCLDVTPRYIHKTVNHSRNFVDPITGCHTNNVEAFWSSLKDKFKKMRGTSYENTPEYLDEHEYIKLYGQTPFLLFSNLLDHISEQYIFD